jgi:hypothetical protein
VKKYQIEITVYVTSIFIPIYFSAAVPDTPGTYVWEVLIMFVLPQRHKATEKPKEKSY